MDDRLGREGMDGQNREPQPGGMDFRRAIHCRCAFFEGESALSRQVSSSQWASGQISSWRESSDQHLSGQE
ncbi:hypothetical protein [Beijerinckia mobilis]|uniref:hypothetical protein n=1 Tax=Beijerinckia mobilis TaxID=231434 RepID=UPI0012EBEC8C|nr:hypothetical protein [Beijerinckia mobilis]